MGYATVTRAGIGVVVLLTALSSCNREKTPATKSSAGGTPLKRTTAGKSSAASGGRCGDDRDLIIKAYEELDIGLELGCNDFTRTRSTEYFGYSDLAPHSGYKWALLRDPLFVGKDKGYGLDLWRENYGTGRQINSAYRDPIHNKKQGGARRSRHMFGDAVDMRNVTRSQDEWDRMWAAAQKADADYIEPLSGPCKLNCLHADWRNHDGDYKQ